MKSTEITLWEKINSNQMSHDHNECPHAIHSKDLEQFINSNSNLMLPNECT